MKPEILPDLKFSDYIQRPELSNSQLNDFAITPAHYWAWNRAPERPERPRSDPMRLGSLSHCLALEPYSFRAMYVVVPDNAPRTPSIVQWKAKKPSPQSVKDMAWWTRFNEEAGNRTKVTEAEVQFAERQSEALKSHPAISKFMQNGIPEVSIFWTHAATGLRLRARIDWLSPIGTLDVKSALDAQPHAFYRSVRRYNYARQAVHYAEAVASLYGELPFTFGVVTNKYPILAASYDLSDEMWLEARDEREELLLRFAECADKNKWPGFSEETQTLEKKSYGDVEIVFEEPEESEGVTSND